MIKFLLIFLISFKAYGQTFITQTSGYAGLLSAGPSYQTQAFTHDILLGYTPKYQTKEAVKSILLRSNLHFNYFFKKFNFKIGPTFGVLMGFDKDLFFLLPSKYPRGYYEPTALRYLGGVGSGLSKGPFEVGLQLAYTDVEITRYFSDNNFQRFKTQELGSLGLYFKFNFGDKND